MLATTQCHKSTIWGWFIPPIIMLILRMGYMVMAVGLPWFTTFPKMTKVPIHGLPCNRIVFKTETCPLLSNL